MSEGASAGVPPPAEAAAGDPARRGNAWRSGLFWSAALVVLALDLWSKEVVFDRLLDGVDPASFATVEEFHRTPRRPWDISGDWLRFVAVLNPGMMWGAFQDHPEVLKVVRPLAVLVIFFLLSGLDAAQWGARLALGGIFGGAIGNIHDSFRYLGVRDFIEVHLRGVPGFSPFPSFNVADSAICVGVAVLALGMMRGRRPAADAPSPPAA